MQQRRKQHIRYIKKQKSIAALHRYLILRCNGLFFDFTINKLKTKQSNPCIKPTVPIMAKNTIQKMQTAYSTASCSPFMIQVAQINQRPLTISKKQLNVKYKKQDLQDIMKKYSQADSSYGIQQLETQQSFNLVKFNNIRKHTDFNSPKQSKINKVKTQSGQILKNDRIKQKFSQCQKKTQNDFYQYGEGKQKNRPWTCIKNKNKQVILRKGKQNLNEIMKRSPLFIMEQAQSSQFNAWDVQSNEASQF